MRITLDHDQWDVRDDQLVGEVLAQVSDRARSRQRLVTSLRLGGRPITDRGLIPSLLAKSMKEVGAVEALSKDVPSVAASARSAMIRLAAILKAEAHGFLLPLRTRGTIPTALDRWFGPLADYVELLQAAVQGNSSNGELQAVSSWIQELLDARSMKDPVRMADILEFEILPHLASL